MSRYSGVPAALTHDAVHRGEPEAGTAAQLLGGEERLEQPGSGPIVHAYAVVAHREGHVRPEQLGVLRTGVGNVRPVQRERPDGERAARRHRVTAVDGEVGDDLFHLAGVGQH